MEPKKSDESEKKNEKKIYSFQEMKEIISNIEIPKMCLQDFKFTDDLLDILRPLNENDLFHNTIDNGNNNNRSKSYWETIQYPQHSKRNNNYYSKMSNDQPRTFGGLKDISNRTSFKSKTFSESKRNLFEKRKQNGVNNNSLSSFKINSIYNQKNHEDNGNDNNNNNNNSLSKINNLIDSNTDSNEDTSKPAASSSLSKQMTNLSLKKPYNNINYTSNIYPQNFEDKNKEPTQLLKVHSKYLVRSLKSSFKHPKQYPVSNNTSNISSYSKERINSVEHDPQSLTKNDQINFPDDNNYQNIDFQKEYSPEKENTQNINNKYIENPEEKIIQNNYNKSNEILNQENAKISTNNRSNSSELKKNSKQTVDWKAWGDLAQSKFAPKTVSLNGDSHNSDNNDNNNANTDPNNNNPAYCKENEILKRISSQNKNKNDENILNSKALNQENQSNQSYINILTDPIKTNQGTLINDRNNNKNHIPNNCIIETISHRLINRDGTTVPFDLTFISPKEELSKVEKES